MLGFAVNVVTDAEFPFDFAWRVEGNDSAVGHDANAVGELIRFLDVLGAHYD